MRDQPFGILSSLSEHCLGALWDSGTYRTLLSLPMSLFPSVPPQASRKAPCGSSLGLLFCIPSLFGESLSFPILGKATCSQTVVLLTLTGWD